MKKIFVIIFYLIFIFKYEAFARTRIILFGDSLMAGYGLTKPDHLSEALKFELKNFNIESEIINGSVSGDTTRGGLNRIGWTLGEKANLVILGLGANDMLRGIDPDEIKGNLNQIILKIKAKNIPIILAGFIAPESYGKNYKEKFDNIYPSLAKEHNLILMPFLLQDVVLNPKLNLEDGKHPNRDGVKVIAKNLTPYLVKQFKK
jgi:acyl-CoA thioesterase-1